MRTKIDYPINGVDISISVSGIVLGESREKCDFEILSVVAKLKNTELLRFDGEDYQGLLAHTELGEEIIRIAETLLLEEKYYEQN